MRKLIISFLLTLSALSASSQVKFGYLSYEQALKSLPAYSTTEKKLADLEAQYNAEMKRAENEFNTKYEEFLEAQSSYAYAIRMKRQSELQELMEKNIAFKQEARRLLAEAREEAYQPLRSQLAERLAAIGQQRGFAFILNTDSNAMPWIDVAQGENIQEAIGSK